MSLNEKSKVTRKKVTENAETQKVQKAQTTKPKVDDFQYETIGRLRKGTADFIGKTAGSIKINSNFSNKLKQEKYEEREVYLKKINYEVLGLAYSVMTNAKEIRDGGNGDLVIVAEIYIGKTKNDEPIFEKVMAVLKLKEISKKNVWIVTSIRAAKFTAKHIVLIKQPQLRKKQGAKGLTDKPSIEKRFNVSMIN